MAEKIVWIDVETTGLDPESHALLEITAHVTDMRGVSESDEFKSILFAYEPSEYDPPSDDVVRLHDVSGLWEDLWSSPTTSYSEGDVIMSEWLDSFRESDDDVFYFGGNSISFDRSFLNVFLPRFYSKIHHRSVDVTSIALMFFNVSGISRPARKVPHRAEGDIKNCIKEYRYIVEQVEAARHVFKAPESE